ncbi:SH3 domain-containing protein [Cucumibacter marinus]|uniref:SH3 domain-containing protein n=1 Tax=Cucumibacter marinus TaxID=1121252 RepID=UPI000428328E|nr:SH3 domain-containing protein [Cucumibacter marinus]
MHTEVQNVRKVVLGLMAGLLITVTAAAFTVQPAHATNYGYGHNNQGGYQQGGYNNQGGYQRHGYQVERYARVNVAYYDHLNVRRWPAHYSQKIGKLRPHTRVWVERCVTVPNSSDWCKISARHVSGWVNSRYLRLY